MYEKLEAGKYFHVYNRGNNGENIFLEKMNYDFFLKKYAKYCFYLVDTYAYCLLKNHFHLLVRVRNPEEVNQMLARNDSKDKTQEVLENKKWRPRLVSNYFGHLFNSYTQAFNNVYDRSGSLFEKRFERISINAKSYFANLLCYIHRNPQKHGFASDFRSYPHSSYYLYLSNGRTRINIDETLKRFGGMKRFKNVHNDLADLPPDMQIE